MTDPAWDLRRANCRGQSALMFSQLTTKAKQVCVGCPVLAACRAATMDYEADQPLDFRWGVAGGLTGPERWRLQYQGQRTSTCRWCGNDFAVEAFNGRLPHWCSDDHARAGRLERDRTAWRRRQRALAAVAA
jgi:hypothetical protein